MSYGQAFPLSQFALERRDGVKPEPVETFGPDLARPLTRGLLRNSGSGDLVCRGCGLVLGDRIVDTRSEWRTFANDEGDDPSRVGAAIDPTDGGEHLETMISFRDGGSGNAKELQRAASRGEDPSHQTISMQLSQLASLLLVVRRTVPRTFREVCNLTNVSKKLLGQCYKALEGAFNLSPGSTATVRSDGARSTGPEQVLARFCNHLALPAFVERMCFEIVVRARDLGIGESRSPTSIAGAVIHFVCLAVPINKNLTEISQVAGVGESTIRLVYRLFHANRKDLVKQAWLDSGKMKAFYSLPADGSDRGIRREQQNEEKIKAQQKATKAAAVESSTSSGVKRETR
ncbi:cyclin-like protein [Flagelloscypha sp. PMI_526]|nr:cyclin-like protein [Flagelloscypha sp. PMI_526]